MEDNSSYRRMTPREKASIAAVVSFVLLIGSLLAGLWVLVVPFFILVLVFAKIHR